MLRKCLVALMMGVICAENAIAEQPAAKGSNPAPTGIVGWFKSKTSSKKSATAKPISKPSAAAKKAFSDNESDSDFGDFSLPKLTAKAKQVDY